MHAILARNWENNNNAAKTKQVRPARPLVASRVCQLPSPSPYYRVLCEGRSIAGSNSYNTGLDNAKALMDMKRNTAHTFLRTPRLILCACCAALVFAVAGVLLVAPSDTSLIRPFSEVERAWADETINTNPTPDELQLEVERSAQALEEARAASEEATKLVKENSARLAELKKQIPVQQRRSAEAAREEYKLQQNSMGVVDFLLSADNFFEFMETWEYIDRVSRANATEMKRLLDMENELEETQQTLEEAQAKANEQQVEAERALAEAQEARAEAQRRAEEEARRQAEEAAIAAAVARAAEEAAAHAAQSAAAGDKTDGDSADGSDHAAAMNEASNAAAVFISDGADWNSDKATFVAEWTARIDAYLAGSPLAGRGKNFAEAAWNYGVDPRWSPAISHGESSKGALCFRDHNAWGWGAVDWDTWEEAIDEHVRGLARGYGYTISIEAAKKYCPPTYMDWYNKTLTQMNMI